MQTNGFYGNVLFVHANLFPFKQKIQEFSIYILFFMLKPCQCRFIKKYRGKSFKFLK